MKKQTLHSTLNQTDEKQRQESISLLNQFLSDFLALALVTKQAHWNMRGANFIAVHEMLDPFNEKLLEWSDTFAERIVQLGRNCLRYTAGYRRDSSFQTLSVGYLYNA